MFLLFDVDDTLVETSRCLTPHCLKNAFDAMKKMGFEGGDFENLVSINHTSASAKTALLEFWQAHSEKESVLEAGLSALEIALPLPDLLPVPGAVALIQMLKKEFPMGIVTRGKREIQIEKLKKAGIDPDNFCTIVASTTPCKKKDYLTAVAEMNQESSLGVVVGDRVAADLSPAKELGLRTVHFRNGRGLVQTEPATAVDWTITSLDQLQEVIHKL